MRRKNRSAENRISIWKSWPRGGIKFERWDYFNTRDEKWNIYEYLDHKKYGAVKNKLFGGKYLIYMLNLEVAITKPSIYQAKYIHKAHVFTIIKGNTRIVYIFKYVLKHKRFYMSVCVCTYMHIHSLHILQLLIPNFNS